MSAAQLAALAAATGLAAWGGTAGVLRYAARRLLDHPNERSSHDRPVPRGGGAALVGAFLVAVAVLWALGWLARPAAAALAGAAAIAAIGWVDDHRHVRASARLAVHAAAAVWALAWLGGLPVLRLGTAEAPLGAAGWVLGVLGIVWVTNLYNFMDGIDGIAAGQALTVCGTAGAILLLATPAAGVGAASVALAAASAGFLAWNWAPARIFMGDVGSGAVGYSIAVLALASERGGGLPLLGWGVLMGVFLVDATLTLLRRLARGERVYEAHRSHAYQRAVQRGRSHGAVSGAVMGVNLLLAAAAAAAAHRPALLLPAAAAAALVLGVLYAAAVRAPR